MDKIIPREGYLDALSHLKNRNLVKVLAGIRRCGKSTILEMLARQIKVEDKTANIIHINFEARKYMSLIDDPLKVDHLLTELIAPDLLNYIFLDEVQNVEGFEKILDGLLVEENVDLYVTGSNAYLLSSEYATILTGRTFTIEVFPYSFKEFILNFPNEKDLDTLFNLYLQIGGFPESVKLWKNNPDDANQYLTELFKAIFTKDIAPKNEIYKQEHFLKVVEFLADSIGSPISTNNIAKALISSGVNITDKTIGKYISSLRESYIFYSAKRYDLKGKKLLKTFGKEYIVDIGLRNAISGNSSLQDLGHKLENIVFLELVRRGGNVRIAKVDNREVDFVVNKLSGETIYYQVSQTILDDNTLKRELASLAEIKDNYKKIILTMDKVDRSINGYQHINLVDWLLDKNQS
jgi:predicted AAA+ superfamily ATPase